MVLGVEDGSLSSPVVRDFLYDAPHSNGQTDEWTDGIGLAKGGTMH